MRKTNPKTIEILEKKITAGRLKLQELYDASGYTDPTVLAYSMKLDRLIVKYQKITMISGISKIS